MEISYSQPFRDWVLVGRGAHPLPQNQEEIQMTLCYGYAHAQVSRMAPYFDPILTGFEVLLIYGVN